jgi:arylsulfatase A-like enzyme
VDPTIVKIPPFLPENNMIRQDLADFYGVINSVDKTVGRILEHLEENNLREGTLFIFTTDHGIPFPRAKCTLYDPGIKTMLLMSWPTSDLFPKGKVIDSLLSNIDLLPTLLDMCGIEIPKGIEGKSFLPILEGHKKEIRSEIYAEKTYHDVYDPIRGLRNKNYKFIRNFEKLESLYQIPLDILRDPSGKYMEKLYNTPRKSEEFYDLQKDPNEQYNLIDNPEYQDIIRVLKKNLIRWMKETQDPLLEGKIKSQPPSNLNYHHY